MQEALDRVMRDHTVLVIAHRLAASTLPLCAQTPMYCGGHHPLILLPAEGCSQTSPVVTLMSSSFAVQAVHCTECRPDSVGHLRELSLLCCGLSCCLSSWCLVCDLRGCRVINKGAVVEQGTHSQLLELGGIYSSLVRKQLQKSASSASFSSLAQVSSESSLRGFLASRSQQS